MLAFSIYETRNSWWFKYAIVMAFSATTEQFTFVALLCRRLFPRGHWQQTQIGMFYFAGFCSLVSKTAVFVGVWVMYSKLFQPELVDDDDDDDEMWVMVWKYAIPPLSFLLYFAQLYGVYIHILIGRKIADEYKNKVGAATRIPQRL
jgi:hypothetical protein